MKEWRPVPSLPGVLASSEGELLLPPRVISMPRGGTKVCWTKPRLGSVVRQNGRPLRRVIQSREFGTVKVHQAVCEAFHGPKPFEGAVVMHKDENPLRNRPGNLTWGTQKENLNAPGFLAYCRSRTGDNSPTKKGRASKP